MAFPARLDPLDLLRTTSPRAEPFVTQRLDTITDFA